VCAYSQQGQDRGTAFYLVFTLLPTSPFPDLMAHDHTVVAEDKRTARLGTADLVVPEVTVSYSPFGYRPNGSS
jgi:hypothetical protein